MWGRYPYIPSKIDELLETEKKAAKAAFLSNIDGKWINMWDKINQLSLC